MGEGCCFACCRYIAAYAARSCAAVTGGSHRVAASGGQGGLGGLRFPPRPSLDSPLPLETPPLRWGDGGGGAVRSNAALCLVAMGEGCCFACGRCIAAFAAHPCAAYGCGSSHVAASGGQGGIGGLRVPAPHCALTRPVFRAAARQPHSSRAARDLCEPSLDSPLPLETPPLRWGDGGGGAVRSNAALCRCCRWWACCFAAYAAHPCAAG